MDSLAHVNDNTNLKAVLWLFFSTTHSRDKKSRSTLTGRCLHQPSKDEIQWTTPNTNATLHWDTTCHPAKFIWHFPSGKCVRQLCFRWTLHQVCQCVSAELHLRIQGGLGPLCPQDLFQAILRENLYIFWTDFGLSPPLGSKLCWAPWPKSWIRRWNYTFFRPEQLDGKKKKEQRWLSTSGSHVIWNGFIFTCMIFFSSSSCCNDEKNIQNGKTKWSLTC